MTGVLPPIAIQRKASDPTAFASDAPQDIHLPRVLQLHHPSQMQASPHGDEQRDSDSSRQRKKRGGWWDKTESVEKDMNSVKELLRSRAQETPSRETPLSKIKLDSLESHNSPMLPSFKHPTKRIPTPDSLRTKSNSSKSDGVNRNDTINDNGIPESSTNRKPTPPSDPPRETVRSRKISKKKEWVSDFASDYMPEPPATPRTPSQSASVSNSSQFYDELNNLHQQRKHLTRILDKIQDVLVILK